MINHGKRGSPAGFGADLLQAVKDGKFDIVKYLLERLDQDIFQRDKWGFTPLHWAARADNLELTKYQVEKHRADPEFFNDIEF